MSEFRIGNLNNPPLNNINGSLVNTDGSSVGGIPFSNTRIPDGPHTLPPAGSNVQGAAGIYPASSQKGGKINRKKINKISRKYKMSGSKRTVRRNVKRMKSRVRSRYSGSRKMRTKRRKMRGGTSSRSMSEGSRPPMKGGAFQQPMTAPNYPNGHTQYQNNNGSLSNTYSTGGVLPGGLSALATPVPYQHVAGDVDNLNHNTLNSNGNIGAGSGFASRGWF
jgi:hypothetical protein